MERIVGLDATGGSIRIALFIPTMHVGGAERVMLLLSRGLSEMGHKVDLVLVQAEGQFLADVPRSVRVVPLRKRRIAASIGALRRYLSDSRPAVLVSALDAANVIAILAGRSVRPAVPVIATVHQRVSAAIEQDFSPNRYAIFQATKHAYGKAAAVVCVSEGVADDLRKRMKLPMGKLSVLPNAVVTPELESLIASVRLRGAVGGGNAPKKIVVAAGRFVPQKDFETLIRAAAVLRERHNFSLQILGDGPLRPRLETLVDALSLNDIVQMPGFVANVPQRLAGADLFVLSSKSEGLPTVLVEALAAGCPVVSTDCPCGPSELLDGGRYGKLVPVGDAVALAAAMSAYLVNPPDASILRERASEFTVAVSSQRYYDLVRKVAA